MRILLMILLAATLASPAFADVYRWTDSKGVIHYTDHPPAKDAQPAQLPNLQTYKPSAPVPTPVPADDSDQSANTPAPPLSIAEPKNEATIRDAQGRISITVATALQPGQGLVYYLDGKAQNDAPTPSTGYLFSGVDRGTHEISAAVVNAAGKELTRSAAVTVFMKPPRVR